MSCDHVNVCINTGLGLALISCCHNHDHDDDEEKEKDKINKKQVSLKYDDDDKLLPSLSLGLSPDHHQQQQASSVSSFSNTSVKREKEEVVEVEVEERAVCVPMCDEEYDQQGSPRKKLRLTKQQSATLEHTFKQHTTLNPKQKQLLAAQLNLRPRQVEVWFQNRRARTKLKQTEEECELLKKCCQTLREENKRLHKEVQELKALKLTTSLYMQIQPPPTLTMCPSCDRIVGTATAASTTATHDHFLNPFTHPSAAC